MTAQRLATDRYIAHDLIAMVYATSLIGSKRREVMLIAAAFLCDGWEAKRQLQVVLGG